jgi:phenylpropionate dioxygenase-like ring-hydroxylating dioxygenase large terminal subunit
LYRASCHFRRNPKLISCVGAKGVTCHQLYRNLPCQHVIQTSFHVNRVKRHAIGPPEFQQIVCPTIDIAGFAGRQVEGFLDVAHFGFVHLGTFGDPKNTRVPSYVPITNEVGFGVDYRSSVANYPIGVENKAPEGFEWLRHFEVHLPFTASITVHFPDEGRLVVMNCASPVSSRMTRLFAPIARNFDKHIAVEAVHEFNRRVFEEDRRAVEAQKPEFLPLDPVMEAHISADRSSFAYRKGLRAMGFSPIFAA